MEAAASHLLWIGNNTSPEMLPAWETFRAAGCQYRESVHDALDHRADAIRRVMLSRVSRIPQPAEFDDLLATYPIARFATISGSLCEGELRTGHCWSSCQRFYWHQWQYAASQWINDCPSELRMHHAPIGITGIVAAKSRCVEGLLDGLLRVGRNAIVLDLSRLSLGGPFRDLLWDDSVVRDVSDWQQIRSRFGDTFSDEGCRHHWLAHCPRITQWKELAKAGFHALHAKPLDLDAVLALSTN